MIATASLGMRFSGRKLFEDVNLKLIKIKECLF